MDALRLMTFNVQCLPLIAGVLDGSISIPGALVGLFPGTDDEDRKSTRLNSSHQI